MNIHEFQAKDLMRQYGVPVPAGSVAHSTEQAAAVAADATTPSSSISPISSVSARRTR